MQGNEISGWTCRTGVNLTDQVVDWWEEPHLAGVGKTHFSSSAFSPQNFESFFFVGSPESISRSLAT